MQQILVVDDEPHVIRILKLSLVRAGYQVDSCANGEQALERLRQSQPDILITDIQMPRMGGRELCQQVRKEFPEQPMLIFVLTSRTEIEHREWSRSLENILFLEKPLSLRKMLSMIKDHFE